MSKTTERYGKPLFTARLATDWPATPSKKLLAQWDRYDRASFKKYGKQYDALNDKEKTALHYELNIAKEAARNRTDAKATEAVLV